MAAAWLEELSETCAVSLCPIVTRYGRVDSASVVAAAAAAAAKAPAGRILTLSRRQTVY